MTQIDELVKRLRDAAHIDPNYGKSVYMTVYDYDFTLALADALEAQAARVKHLEAELDIANKQIAETGRALTADRECLKARLDELRVASEKAAHAMFPFAEVATDDIHAKASNSAAPEFANDLGEYRAVRDARTALMSALRNAEGEKNGVE